MDRLVSRIQGFLLRPVTRPVAWPQEPDWHRDAVGGMWDEIGQLQFKFLVDQGLQPGHRLLDVGCGSLRGGVHFARYLDSGNYFGVDIDQALLDAGRLELERYHLIAKKVTLAQTDSFDFQSLQQKFDYALAQSVFTHLPLNSIIRCVLNMEPVLVRGGRFYATFFENPKGKFHLAPSSHPFSISKWDGITYFDQDPYHYSFETFEWIVEGANLTVEYRGDWGHPNDQRMMVFTKTC